jgi:hypothetical protein
MWLTSDSSSHDGAVDLRFLVNDKLVCRSLAVYGADGNIDVNGAKWETISSYTPCNEPIKVSKGDKLGLASEYDLTKHRLWATLLAQPVLTDNRAGGQGVRRMSMEWRRRRWRWHSSSLLLQETLEEGKRYQFQDGD